MNNSKQYIKPIHHSIVINCNRYNVLYVVLKNRIGKKKKNK